MNINQCPHCSELPPSAADPVKIAFWQMRHLLSHALLSVTSLTLDELPDVSYYDFVEGRTDELNPWPAAARNAVECLVNEMFPMLADLQWSTSVLYERGALGECKSDTSAHAANWGKGMYFWLRQHYTADVEPWNQLLERSSGGA